MPSRVYQRRVARRQRLIQKKLRNQPTATGNDLDLGPIDQQLRNQPTLTVTATVHDLGPMDKRCDHCGAFRWKDENVALCCARGQVTLPPLLPPPEYIQNLLTDNSAEAKHFRDNIRGYNRALAIASLGVNEDIQPPLAPEVDYCFRVSGEVHHLLVPLLPEANERPQLAQLYIYDTANETQNRQHQNSGGSGLNPELLHCLQETLHKVNPYVQVYKHAADAIRDADIRAGEVRMVFKADSAKDPRSCNLPQASEVEVILPDMPCDVTARDIVLYRYVTDDPRGKDVVRISESHPHYDPLHYVLLFPHGDLLNKLMIKLNVEQEERPRSL